MRFQRMPVPRGVELRGSGSITPISYGSVPTAGAVPLPWRDAAMLTAALRESASIHVGATAVFRT